MMNDEEIDDLMSAHGMCCTTSDRNGVRDAFERGVAHERNCLRKLIAAAKRVAENYDPEPVGLSPIEQGLVDALMAIGVDALGTSEKEGPSHE